MTKNGQVITKSALTFKILKISKQNALTKYRVNDKSYRKVSMSVKIGAYLKMLAWFN